MLEAAQRNAERAERPESAGRLLNDLAFFREDQGTCSRDDEARDELDWKAPDALFDPASSDGLARLIEPPDRGAFSSNRFTPAERDALTQRLVASEDALRDFYLPIESIRLDRWRTAIAALSCCSSARSPRGYARRSTATPGNCCETPRASPAST